MPAGYCALLGLSGSQPDIPAAQERYVQKTQDTLESVNVAPAFKINGAASRHKVHSVATAPVNFQVQGMFSRGHVQLNLLGVPYLANSGPIEDNLIGTQAVSKCRNPLYSNHLLAQ